MFTSKEIEQLEKYLKQTFGNQNLQIKQRPKTADSVEVLLGGEFIGVLYKDTDEGETSYDFNMAILSVDLPA